MSTVGAAVLALGALNEIENIQNMSLVMVKRLHQWESQRDLQAKRKVYLDFYHKTKRSEVFEQHNFKVR